MEIRPGLAPGKRWVAAIRLDGFGMRIIGLPDGCCPRALSLTCSGAAVTPRATSDWSLPPDVRRTLRGTNSARRFLRMAGVMVFPPRLARGTRPSQSRVMSPSPRERKGSAAPADRGTPSGVGRFARRIGAALRNLVARDRLALSPPALQAGARHSESFRAVLPRGLAPRFPANQASVLHCTTEGKVGGA